MTHTGGCLCGAVRYEIDEMPTNTGPCHCSMCQKWSGGVFMGFHVKKDHASFTGAEHIGVYNSSEWAARAFCKTCGSSLYYQITAPHAEQGDFHFGLGTLDDPRGLTLTTEVFCDAKPDIYAFAGEHTRMTDAETIAMFTAPPEE